MGRVRRPSVALSLLLVALGAGAAGGCHKKTAGSPNTPVAAGSAGAPVVAPQDTLDDSDPNAPKMNSSALSAYRRGLQAWQAGDVAGARAAFLDAAKADPAAPQPYYALGAMQERLGDPDALASYRQSYTITPSYEPALIGYAMLLARKGSLAEADDFLTDRKGRMPRSAAVLAALAEVKSLKKDTGTAQQLAQDALKINPDYRPAMVVLARDHYRNRRLDLALYALKAILDGEGANNPARDKNNAEAHLLRAVILKEQGRRALSIDELRKTVALRPDLVEAKVQLAAYLLESGNADEALPLLETALKYNQANLNLHLNLGDAYRLLGRVPDAKREFDLVATKDPSVPQVYYSLGLLYLFAPTVPGMDDKTRIANAISSLEKYQQLRGKPQQGSAGSDDSDQLLLRAKAKQGELSAADQAAAASASAAAAPPPPAPPAASGSAGAASAPPPAASAAPPKKK